MTTRPRDDDGYRLWLRYEPIADPARLAEARAATAAVYMPAPTPVLAAARDELARGLTGLLATDVTFCAAAADATLIVGTPRVALGLRNEDVADGSPLFSLFVMAPGGYVVDRVSAGGSSPALAVISLTDEGVLYGVFHLLRRLQIGGSAAQLSAASGPRAGLRMLDHWDNLDGSIERGYAGRSLWQWDDLPGKVDPRYTDYARANASIGINAVALNNVNASALMLTPDYLRKVAALAGVFRAWGMRVFLSARWTAPVELAGLPNADPRDERVAAWWRAKAEEIYALIPDFGGFLVKANSEGQPGPQDYGRTHADGANVLADALAPHGGVVIWRAFVYKADVAEDRAKQAYNELVPLDGKFLANVRLQVKNGPIDFQPREPFHPLFGAMPATPLLLELQITQEYLGFATHLAYLAPMWSEVLGADTCTRLEGAQRATVGAVVDGSMAAGGHGYLTGGIAAVANTGDARNWCGHPFAQANWYAFGRLTWDHTLSPAAVADEWLRMTFTSDGQFVAPAAQIMLASREAVVDYMTPLGLHHLMAEGHHHGPGPWVDSADAGRADWTSVYYHRADANGIGFDRTATGSDAVSLYRPPLRERFADPNTCPENLLLWFHHVAWDHRMSSGRMLWDELCHRYTRGVDTVRGWQRAWETLAPLIDAVRAEQVRGLLAIQEKEARWWRNACLLYFQTFSTRPLPDELEPLEGSLETYRAIR